jgi:hypothetical protein
MSQQPHSVFQSVGTVLSTEQKFATSHQILGDIPHQLLVERARRGVKHTVSTVATLFFSQYLESLVMMGTTPLAISVMLFVTKKLLPVLVGPHRHRQAEVVEVVEGSFLELFL